MSERKNEQAVVPLFFLLESQKDYTPHTIFDFALELSGNQRFAKDAAAFATRCHPIASGSKIPGMAALRPCTGARWQEAMRKQFDYHQIGQWLTPAQKDVALRSPGPKKFKYEHFIRALDSFATYTASEVANRGLDNDLDDPELTVEKNYSLSYGSLKHLCERYLRNHVDERRLFGATPTSAYFGLRWKTALRERCYSEAERLALWESLTMMRQDLLNYQEEERMTISKQPNKKAKSRFGWPSPGFSWKSLFAGVPALILAVAFVAWMVDGDRVERAYDALVNDGPTSALSSFIDQPPATEAERFSNAWILYKRGDRDRASHILTQLLEADSENSIGPCNFLLATIQREQGYPREAEKTIHQAIEFYRQEFPEDYFKSKLVLLQITIDQYTRNNPEKLAEAESLLDEIESEAPMASAQIFQLRARLAFEKGNFEDVLVYAQYALESSKSVYEEAVSHAWTAFALILNGDLELAFAETQIAKQKARVLENASIIDHTELYRFYIGQCTSTIPYKIDHFVAQDAGRFDPSYKRFLHFFENVTCPHEHSFSKDRETFPPPRDYYQSNTRTVPMDPGPPTYPTGGGGGGEQ
jgi:tetratricopeptide (TPR) repeat protein